LSVFPALAEARERGRDRGDGGDRQSAVDRGSSRAERRHPSPGGRGGGQDRPSWTSSRRSDSGGRFESRADRSDRDRAARANRESWNRERRDDGQRRDTQYRRERPERRDDAYSRDSRSRRDYEYRRADRSRADNQYRSSRQPQRDGRYRGDRQYRGEGRYGRDNRYRRDDRRERGNGYSYRRAPYGRGSYYRNAPRRGWLSYRHRPRYPSYYRWGYVHLHGYYYPRYYYDYDSYPTHASIRLLVEPSDAEVYVDDYYAGVVDDFDGVFQRLHLTPGAHEITLRLGGYQTWSAEVYAEPGRTLRVHHDMIPGASGPEYEEAGPYEEPPPDEGPGVYGEPDQD
jgi:hypothetical protein